MKYRIHLCLNGMKGKKASTYEFDDRREWKMACRSLPFDIIDESDTEVWFDWGDE